MKSEIQIQNTSNIRWKYCTVYIGNKGPGAGIGKKIPGTGISILSRQ